MIVVTGAAGFIGSCLVARLNELGRQDLIVVDHFDNDQDPKKRNLVGKRYQRYYDKAEYLKLLKRDAFDFDVESILHMGACSSTTCQDALYFQQNNLEYSQVVAQWALKHQARLVYASSAATYGDGTLGYDDDENKIKDLKPLNLYGQSKQDFDQWVLDHGFQTKMVGLKFFNVFGPNEYHKDDMRSVVAKAYEGVAKDGKMVLFKSYHPAYKDGEQKRDFVYVKDVVEVVLHFMNTPSSNGIYNVGTGEASTWIDLAKALFAAVGKEVHIDFIDMPEVLKSKYQYFTQANINKLRGSGYGKPFMPLANAVKDYVGYLKDNKLW